MCLRTFDHRPYVARAIEGVLEQEVDFPWEVIVADDHSTDGTLDVIERYRRAHPDLIRVITNERNVGGRANFVAVHRESRGEYLAWLDGDDYWTSPHKLQRQADALDANARWQLALHAMAVVDEHGEPVGTVFPTGPHRPEWGIEQLRWGNAATLSSMMFRRTALDSEWDWFVRSPRPGDWCLALLLARDGPIGCVEGVLGAYRSHPGGWWSSAERSSRRAEGIEMLRAIRERVSWRDARRIDLAVATFLIGDRLPDPVRRVVNRVRSSVKSRRTPTGDAASG